MNRAPTEPAQPPAAAGGAPQSLELRHLRYFVALADAGSFTHAAEQLFIAQPTLSQQIRRLEESIGTPLLHRRREGLRLTAAGSVLLEESRNVLSLVDHGLSQTRQAAGLGRPGLRMVVPPDLPEALAVKAAAGLRSAALAVEVDMVWLESALDAEFSLIRTRRADAGLGWLTTSPEALPAPLDVMILGEFEPDVWIPSTHAAARCGSLRNGPRQPAASSSARVGGPGMERRPAPAAAADAVRDRGQPHGASARRPRPTGLPDHSLTGRLRGLRRGPDDRAQRCRSSWRSHAGAPLLHRAQGAASSEHAIVS